MLTEEFAVINEILCLGTLVKIQLNSTIFKKDAYIL